MEVQMIDRLAAVRPRVDHDPVAVREILFAGYPVDDEQHAAKQGLVFLGLARLRERPKVSFGNYQQMDRCLRMDIAKRDTVFVLENPGGWNLSGYNFAE
jgi:hypothetical protein